jgi:DNA-binding transcriptional LysR family regulator
LTEDGLALKQQAGQVEQKVNQIHRVFRGSETELSGSLKISKPSSGFLNLAPMLSEFHRQYPNIDLQLTASTAFSELNRLEADVAIRVTDKPPEELVARGLGRVPVHIYGSRDYLRRCNTLDPAQCQWIVWQDEDSSLNVEPGIKSQIPDAKIVMRTNSYSEVYEAVKAGIGVSLLSCLRLPQDHQLQALSPELYQFNMGLWLLSHPDLRNRERVKVFVTEQFGSVLPQ